VLDSYSDEWIDNSQEARIVFLPIGEKNIYRFWFQQRGGKSSGMTRIDICDNPEDIKQECSYGQMKLKWYEDPKIIGDGKIYLIGEIKETLSDVSKQIVLYLVKSGK
jgi:hypothetical protein